VRFLGERDASRPFFLNVAFTAPHDPRTPPPEYERMYEPERMALPGNFMASPRFDPGTLNIRDEKRLPLPREAAAVRREIGRYYGLITHLDAQIGRILDALEKHKLADDTIVIFVGDNGLALGAHGLLGKQTMYDEGVRVPLIVRHPRLEGRRGETRDALVDLIDLLPTICDWTGTPPPPSVDGRSFAGLLKGETPRVRDAIFGTYDEKDTPLFRMIRTERYKLICYLQLNREELFDLQADPLELKDLSDDPGLQEVRDRLRARLKELRKSAGEKVDEPAAK
jgi:arylsulfatase A-like enzyme